jgi:hypothetical protein
VVEGVQLWIIIFNKTLRLNILGFQHHLLHILISVVHIFGPFVLLSLQLRLGHVLCNNYLSLFLLVQSPHGSSVQSQVLLRWVGSRLSEHVHFIISERAVNATWVGGQLTEETVLHLFPRFVSVPGLILRVKLLCFGSVHVVYRLKTLIGLSVKRTSVLLGIFQRRAFRLLRKVVHGRVILGLQILAD